MRSAVAKFQFGKHLVRRRMPSDSGGQSSFESATEEALTEIAKRQEPERPQLGRIVRRVRTTRRTQG